MVSPDVRYAEPAAEVVEIVDAPPTPGLATAPDGLRMILAERVALPDLEILAAPMQGLAGERINPVTTERRRTRFYDDLAVLETVGERAGTTTDVAGLPEGPALSFPDWSPDGRKFAFTHTSDQGVELWVVDDVDRPRARRLTGRAINGTFSDGFAWAGGSERLLVHLVPEGRGPAPVGPAVAQGPVIEQTRGAAATNRTYRDLLQTPLDDARFTHAFTRELALVDLEGAVTPLGAGDSAQGVFTVSRPSPDGRWLLVERLVEPYSHAVPWYRFGHRLELWSLTEPEAAPIALADNPAAEEVPIEGVPTGPRAVGWQALEDATLVWAEALDGGDPSTPAEHRDVLRRLAAPFEGRTLADGIELTRTRQRYTGVRWLGPAARGRYLLREYDRDRRWTTTHLRDVADPELDRVYFDRSVHDRYADPGSPVFEILANDVRVVRVEGEGEDAAMFLSGVGGTPEGDRPFLDRRRLDAAASDRSERLFHSHEDAYEAFAGFSGDTEHILVRRESRRDPPNWYRQTVDGRERAQLTEFPHPHPAYGDIDKRLLTYSRADGVPLSATLYLPPGYDPESGERLPMLVWAYPREYVDADTAGQVRAAPTRFTRLSGTSPTLFLTQGYAVLYAAMPVVGDPATMNDTLIEQLVAGAEAAIAAAEATGTVDRDRVGVGGHSYGAFMVANLLAHSDLFRAGVARSGAYNRTLTPFGFQSERRTLWEAPEAYTRVSPLFAVDTLDEPILLIHGEIDDNSGTFPIQTRRLFHALQGLGGTARMVMLPHEAHGYRARQSVLHVLHESFAWFDAHVKNP